MGVDLEIWINKKDLEKLLGLNSDLSSWDDFYFLLKYDGIRWYRFTEMMGVDDSEVLSMSSQKSFTSKELLEHLAKTNVKVKDRSYWVDICMNYDLIFAPDTEKIEDKNYIRICEVEKFIINLTKKNIPSLLKGQ